jgi:2-dehydropantoate 2-reductase
MKILVFGAGVIGSFNAARLTRGGHDVTLLARGQRLAQLREHGIVLESARTGTRTTTRVPLVERLAPDDAYELAVVVLRRNQVPSVLPVLAQATRVPSVLFLGNSVSGPRFLVEVVGYGRVLSGMANAGGERQGHVVRYLWWRRLPLVLGELDGRRSRRALAIVSAFESAGLAARLHPDIDAMLRTHAVGVPLFAGALYRAGGSVRRLARRPDLLRLCVESQREAMRALKRLGIRPAPAGTSMVLGLPTPALVLALRLFLDTDLAVVGGERHANVALDEMKELADEVRQLLRQTDMIAPASQELLAAVDARVRGET